ncbi:MAG: hypothetical protein ACE364_07795 [Chlorobiota bacterium]
MSYIFNKNLIFLLLIVTFYSCSDDSGTDPNDGFIGATFQLEDGQTWEYKRYLVEEEVDELFGMSYYKVESNGMQFGKKSFKFFASNNKEDLGEGKFGLTSTDENGYYSIINDSYSNFIEIFPELENKWIKQIDYKSENWTQFDLKLDSTLENGSKLNAIFKISGTKGNDTKVEYKNETYSATQYKSEIVAIIRADDIALEDIQYNVETILIEGIGIFRTERNVLGSEQKAYELLVDNK